MRHPLSLLPLSSPPAAAVATDARCRPPKDIGFNKPTKSLKANMEASDNWTCGPTSAPPNLSVPQHADRPTCRRPSRSRSTRRSRTSRPATPVPGAIVTAFAGHRHRRLRSTTADVERDDGTRDDHDADRHEALRLQDDRRHSAGPRSTRFLLNQYLDPEHGDADLARQDPERVERDRETLPALIGETRTPGTGVARRCAPRLPAPRDVELRRDRVERHRGTRDADRPARRRTTSAAIAERCRCTTTQHESASSDGLFMLIQLPGPPSAFVQMWGYPTRRRRRRPTT